MFPGPLNAAAHELIAVCNKTYINAESVCGLLCKISNSCIGIPITVVPELPHIPPYSPNLILIERLWKFMKKKCLRPKYYAGFEELKTAISDCLNQTHTTYKDELQTLLP